MANDATNGAEVPPVVPPVVVAPVRPVTPSEASRTHLDAIELVQIVAPMFVALTIIVCYMIQVWHTGSTDSVLGQSVPVIVAAYFVTAGAGNRHRRGGA